MCSITFLLGRKQKLSLPDNQDHLSAFRLALNNITFSEKWIYIRLREFNIVEQIKQQEL